MTGREQQESVTTDVKQEVSSSVVTSVSPQCIISCKINDTIVPKVLVDTGSSVSLISSCTLPVISPEVS